VRKTEKEAEKQTERKRKNEREIERERESENVTHADKKQTKRMKDEEIER
jgi:hypothetical protein